MLHLGRARALSGDLEGGIALVEEAAATYEKAGSRMGLLEARTRLAEICVFAGRTEAASDALAAARLLEQTIGETPISAMIDRVEVTLEAGRSPERALALLGAAMDRARALGASFDLLVLLTLADRLDQGRTGEEADLLARELAVVSLVVLPER